ncbi:hypothetical protein Patl1_19072 [Pistacia atlantica]|uniref:Uncharacterized protein n=1 Tax=Pistacia atlantica TaxID=434234 RepID=A0ACC1C000_9ROSI|nr:hypothetical protein Patl1_19072 [Pistacia atlantica]
MRAYRDLIRPTRYSFTGNIVMLRESVEEFCKRFIKNCHINSNTEIQKLLEHACLFSLLIRSLIAKSEFNQRGGFAVRATREIPSGEGLEALSKELF